MAVFELSIISSDLCSLPYKDESFIIEGFFIVGKGKRGLVRFRVCCFSLFF